MGVLEDDHAIKVEIERFYLIARESLSVVWKGVETIAKALLKHEELDRAGLDAALGEMAIYQLVLPVQRAHGLFPRTPT